MLSIRLRRAGKKNSPFYRIVVADKNAPIKGKFIENLGFYNPILKNLEIKKELIIGWIDKGASPSNRVAKLMKIANISHPKVKVKIYPKKEKKQNKEEPEIKAKPAENVSSESPSDQVEDNAKSDASENVNSQDNKEIKEEGE